jgi:circadian clock protein KaiB
VTEVPEEDKQGPQDGSDDVIASFEAAAAIADPQQQHYCLRLYIAGTTTRSMSALQRLKAICETHLQGRYELEVIDVYQTDLSLLTDNIVAVPTLIKQLPSPLRRIIGDLSDTEKVLLGLDLIAR